jgi:predicted metal-binding protein
MIKPVLFVCKSCNTTSKKDSELSEGAYLLDRLNKLNKDKIIIQEVGCLWMCERACVAALSAGDGFTYLFTDLPAKESPEALLELADLCFNNQGKSIPYKEFPKVLKSSNIARIPAITTEFM